MLRFKEHLRHLVTSHADLLSELYRLSLVQCNSYGSLNVRRFVQLVQLYKRLYNEKSVYGLLRNFSRRWQIFAPNPNSRHSKKFAFLLGGGLKGALGGGTLLSASIFSFTVHGIADEDMIEAANSLTDLSANETSLVSTSSSSAPSRSASFSSSTDQFLPQSDSIVDSDWELLTERSDFHVWRRQARDNTKLYEYKCAGRFYDVPAYGFYIAQIDLDYRKQWDHLVVLLDVVESDTETGSEVIRWITHFPFPMCPREYVYVRRSCVDPLNKKMVLTSKTVNHPKCPRDDRKYVRVDNYYSCMVIKPHKEFHDNGFDYVLTYFDDPKAPFPSLAYNWIVTTGVPNFVEKVYQAAKGLATNNEKINDMINSHNNKNNTENSKNFSDQELSPGKMYHLPATKSHATTATADSTAGQANNSQHQSNSATDARQLFA